MIRHARRLAFSGPNLGVALAFMVALFAFKVHAQEGATKDGAPDNESASHNGEAGDGELAKSAQNPIGNLISLPFQNNLNLDVGPSDRTQDILNIQPVLPIGLSKKWNLITRTILPAISQPAPGTDRTSGLGDLNFTGFFSPKEPGKLIWGVGPALVFPTATDDVLGAASSAPDLQS